MVPLKQLDPIKVLEIGKVFGSLTGGAQLLLAKRSLCPPSVKSRSSSLISETALGAVGFSEPVTPRM